MMYPGEPWSKSAKTNLGGVDNGSGVPDMHEVL